MVPFKGTVGNQRGRTLVADGGSRGGARVSGKVTSGHGGRAENTVDGAAGVGAVVFKYTVTDRGRGVYFRRGIYHTNGPPFFTPVLNKGAAGNSWGGVFYHDSASL